MNYFQLASRNILRHRNRSIITVMTVCLGFTALGVIGGMLNNIFSRLRGQAIVTQKLGHISFAREGFFVNGKQEPEKYLWEKQELNSILSILRSDPDIILATPRLRMFGIASTGKASTIFITEAIVPEDDQKLLATPIDGRTITPGAVSLNSDKSNHASVAIASELASILGIGKGQYFTLLTTTKTGQVNAVDVDVEEIFNTGNPSTNDKFVLTNFSLAQELYDTEGAERIVVTIKNPAQVNAVKARLLDKIKKTGISIEAQGWEEQSPTYGKVTTMFGAIFRVLTIIITLIVLLTMLNTMQMAISERTKEIGTMRAIGMLRKQVVRIFVVEGIIMAIAGCIVAIPILLAISNILKWSHASFVPPVASTSVPLVLMLDPQKIVLVFMLFFIATLFTSFFIARKISRQQVVESLMQFN